MDDAKLTFLESDMLMERWHPLLEEIFLSHLWGGNGDEATMVWTYCMWCGKRFVNNLHDFCSIKCEDEYLENQVLKQETKNEGG
jgi:hypothetical protein